MTHHPRRVAVVGGGLAGLETCRALRDQGYAGGITLFGAEDVPPYDRPPLSKEVLLGELDDTTLPFDFAAHAVEVRLGDRIESIDALDAEQWCWPSARNRSRCPELGPYAPPRMRWRCVPP